MKHSKVLIALLCLITLLFAGCAPVTEVTEPTEPTVSPTEATPVPTDSNPLEGSDVSIAVLKGPTAMGMIKLIDDFDSGVSDGNNYNFTISPSADAITPLLVQGQLDIAAVPANLASVLYNNTSGEITVLAVNTLGVLYIVENGNSVQSVDDLRGKTVYLSGKGSSPEYALNYMLDAYGLEIGKDITVEFKSEHSECVAALLSDTSAVALLPQPFVTAAQAGNENIRIAIDLNEAWQNAHDEAGKSATLITGVIVCRTAFLAENPDAVKIFLNSYKNSVDWVLENTADAASLIGKYEIVTAAVAEKALPYCAITYISGSEMQEKLSSYLTVLYGQNPTAVGGALPDDAFYYLG